MATDEPGEERRRNAGVVGGVAAAAAGGAAALRQTAAAAEELDDLDAEALGFGLGAGEALAATQGLSRDATFEPAVSADDDLDFGAGTGGDDAVGEPLGDPALLDAGEFDDAGDDFGPDGDLDVDALLGATSALDDGLGLEDDADTLSARQLLDDLDDPTDADPLEPDDDFDGE